MKVLVVGSGGREHAICWKLAQSPNIVKLYCAPGNGGIESIAECLPLNAEDVEGICSAAREREIDLVVVGPEVPLAMGLVDALSACGIKAFGPNKKCAQLEASKSFTKSFLSRHNIPTAGYREFTKKEDLLNAVGIFGFPMVLKADGLAAGKGVVIAETPEEAVKAIEDMMGDRIFGAAGDKVVVEEYLSGIEASMLCFVDELTIVPMESAQDYKRIFDGDLGPNTGGMGSYSPSLVFTEELSDKIRTEILEPTLKGFQQDGLDFKGVLFVGLMITDKGPKVIEFNNRFGDPETQAVLPRMESDLLDIFLAVTENRLNEIDIKWSGKKSICVVLAAGGYPGTYEKGKKITGLDAVDADVMIFHAGTIKKAAEKDSPPVGQENGILTNGGRVLGVAVTADTLDEARKRAFENVSRIYFDGMQYRKDIGKLVNK